jgi:hypothetical protein
MSIYEDAPEWATHEGRFCNLVPVYIGDIHGDFLMQAQGPISSVAFVIVLHVFQFFAMLSNWDTFPIKVTKEL